jgi:putative transposase
LRSDNTILIRFWKGIGIVRKNLFWLSDEQWERIELHLPTDVRGVQRVDDRRVISGIVHVLKSGCRWCDCPPEYGSSMTIYNRFVRWARRGVWENLFRELAGSGRSTDTQMIDSTHIKAHRSAAGGKGGSRSRPLAARAAGATRRFTHSQMLKGALSPSC